MEQKQHDFSKTFEKDNQQDTLLQDCETGQNSESFLKQSSDKQKGKPFHDQANPHVQDHADSYDNNEDSREDTKKRPVWTYWVLCVFFFGLCAALGISSLIIPDLDVSRSERRKLRQLPEMSISSVLSGKFGSSFEAYALDQLPQRQMFLDLRSLASRYLFWNLDDNGIVSWNSSLIKLEQEQNSLDYAVKVFDSIYTKYLQDSNCKVYLAIVPDKAYFIDDPKYALMDYDSFLSQAAKALPNFQSIDLTKTLSLEDYYSTDSHWNQVHLQDTANALADAMGVHLIQDYQQLMVLESFTGVYGGQSAWPAEKDMLEYLYNPEMDDWKIYSYEKGKEVPLYDLDAAYNLDPYDLFLGGNTGLLRIENPHANNNRELVVLRDSFGSAFVPLLASGYKTVYVADIRFLPSAQLGRYIDFTDQDVLFLYSTSVLNHASVLK